MHVRGKVVAMIAATQLVFVTAVIGAEPQVTTPTPTLTQQAQFRASLDQALTTLATASVVDQDAAQPTRRRREEDPEHERDDHHHRHHSQGMPAWVKYSLVGAAAAGGGYALSQVGHHGGNDGRRIDSDVSMGR
jgi:hypothetical protein